MKKAAPTLVQILKDVGRTSGRYPHEVFRSFCLISACAVAFQTREHEYLAEIARWKPETYPLFQLAFATLVEEMEHRPYEDVLGPIHMEWGAKSGKSAGGEFYTPWNLCQALARMQISKEMFDKSGPVTLLEPACGSGSMVLAFAEAMREMDIPINRLQATCVDTSRLACDMCYVNLALWGVPAQIIHGNSLSLETWGAWRTIHWALAEHPMVRLLETMNLLVDRSIEEGENAPPATFVIPKPKSHAQAAQMSLNFEPEVA